ncbi:hypothetical protein [Actinokineospora auranticolor]|uniref:hypothetical protein n=1 Tax=Actinokineospora auranticolor TaxID=155976 RepID=UPI0015E2AB81|nr:hypothetical protein [Actinokineospora auranticolor]
MRDLLAEVFALQPQFTAENLPPMQRRGQLIRRTIPTWLRGEMAKFAPPGID